MSGITVPSLKPQGLTWETALRLFSLRRRSQNLSELTQELYQSHLSQFSRWNETNESPRPAEVTAALMRRHRRLASSAQPALGRGRSVAIPRPWFE